VNALICIRRKTMYVPRFFVQVQKVMRQNVEI
jgi:hypothetical protein